MHLTIIRHATAEGFHTSGTDSQRQLTDHGMLEAQSVGRVFAQLGLKPDLVMHSPYVRARQTAEQICEQAELDAPVPERFLQSGMSPQNGLHGLADYKNLNHVVIVGHEPDLSGLISLLTSMPHSNVAVYPGSVWGIECLALREGGGVLRYSIPPDYSVKLA